MSLRGIVSRLDRLAPVEPTAVLDCACELALESQEARQGKGGAGSAPPAAPGRRTILVACPFCRPRPA